MGHEMVPICGRPRLRGTAALQASSEHHGHQRMELSAGLIGKKVLVTLRGGRDFAPRAKPAAPLGCRQVGASTRAVCGMA